MKYTVKTTAMVTPATAPGDVVPGHCFVDKKKSRAVEIRNNGRSTLKNIALAVLSQGDDFWRSPIEIAAKVPAKGAASFDLRPENIRLVECKLKFTSPDGTFTDSIVADRGLFISCVGLTVHADGKFTTWWTQMALPGGK